MVIFLNNTNDDLAPFYSFAVHKAEVGIHAINVSGKTIIYNEKMKKIEGLALIDVQDRSILELFSFEQEESTLLKVLQSAKPLLNIKQTYWNRNGIEITTVNNTYPVFKKDQLIGAVEISRDVTALESFTKQAVSKKNQLTTFDQIIASSDEMKTVISTAKKAAITNLPVLLIGETGTGKDLIAESIHNKLTRQNESFYTLRCHSSDPLIIENFFKESTTAEPYTLFCERIDLLTISLQTKLLEALSVENKQHRQFIASIGDDPVSLIASGSLLKELYYFFASFSIHIPPLRNRKEDIGPFINNYLTERRERFNSSLVNVAPEVKELFLDYDWPGNVRELEFILNEIASLASIETIITYDMLPFHFRLKIEQATNKSIGPKDFIITPDKVLKPLDTYLHEAEAYYLEKAMKLYKGNVTKTANALGMSRQSLQYRLRKIKKSEE